MLQDSLDKIIGTYFAGITRSSFTYKDRVYPPQNLLVSHLLFRGYTCPENCGGCCPRFSLDYLTSEYCPMPQVKLREVDFNGSKIPIISDMQLDHQDHHCKNLTKSNGRCGIHGNQPFSCDFELCRFLTFNDRNVLTSKLFGRGWAFLRTDNERGALCEMLPVTKETIDEVIRKLIRLKQWAEYFGVDHCLDAIIQWARSGSGMDLLIPKHKKVGLNIKSISGPQEEDPLIQIEL